MEGRRRRPRHIQKERTRHGKTVFYYRANRGSRRVRLLGEYGSPEFWGSYTLAASSQGQVPDVPLVPVRRRAEHNEIELCIRRALPAAKHRAKKKGMAFDLTEDWVHEQIKRQDFKCALTGIPFSADDAHYRVKAYAPSLDRIDNAFGYTTDNVRIVCFAVNAMMLDWGEEIFLRITEGYRRVRNKEMA